MTDFPFPPPKDAALLVLSLAGWAAFVVFGIRTLIKRVRR